VDPWGAAVLVIASLAWACGSLYSKHGGMPSSPMLGVAMQSSRRGDSPDRRAVCRRIPRLHLGAISLRSWLALGYLVVFGSASDQRVHLHSSQKYRRAWQPMRL